MKISETLRAMAKELERSGFSTELGGEDGPCCFIGAKYRLGQDNSSVIFFMGETLDMSFGEPRLEAEGWTTPDAVAACLIAADIAEVQGK